MEGVGKVHFQGKTGHMSETIGDRARITINR